MECVEATLLAVWLLILHWTLASDVADHGCHGFKHLENGRTFFRYGGLYVTFSCNPGFRIHGYRTSSCVSGQWAREPPLCVAQGCQIPGEIPHGSRVISPDRSIVHFTCNIGFRLFGSPLIYCKGKSWNDTVPVCKESDIMSSFHLKQPFLFKPGLELNMDALPSLKRDFHAIANIAAKEAFLKPSFLSEDIPKGAQKPLDIKATKKIWFDKVTTPEKGRTVDPREIISRLDLQKPTADPIAQPLLTESLMKSTAVTRTLPCDFSLLRHADSTVTSATNDKVQVFSTPLNQLRFTSTTLGYETRDLFSSAIPKNSRDLITRLQVLSVSRKYDLNTVLPTATAVPTANSHSAKFITHTFHEGSIGDTTTSSQGTLEESESSGNIRKPPSLSSMEQSIISHSAMLTVPEIQTLPPTRSSDRHVSEPLSSMSFTKSTVFSPPFISAVFHDVLLQGNSKTEDFSPYRTEVLTTTTSSQPVLQVSQIPASSSLLRSIIKNKTSVTKNQSQENQSVISETLDSKNGHRLNLTISEIPVFSILNHRPMCPYPPLPAHGTFYFRTITNPAPFQYKHYVQYACYPGYTLAEGDVYSYCLQDGQWSGVTPVCIEVTPCLLNNGGCSQLCRASERNRAECSCKSGFLLLEDQRTCRDLDECVEGLHHCQQVCENTFGSYRCNCRPGFQLSADRMSCADVNECVRPAGRARCVFGCVNTPGSFHCRCPAGYSVNGTDGHCIDFDECKENEGHGPCVSGCVNTPGSFNCVCPYGQQLAGDGRSCVSQCPSGYQKQDVALRNSTELCVDIDECVEMEQNQRQRCEGKCLNLPGTHHCLCPRGFTQDPDRYHCNDINECGLKNGGCSHICINRRGGYKCTCRENYRISPYNKRKCQPLHSTHKMVS